MEPGDLYVLSILPTQLHLLTQPFFPWSRPDLTAQSRLNSQRSILSLWLAGITGVRYQTQSAHNFLRSRTTNLPI